MAFLGTRLLGERDARQDSEHRAEVAAAQIRARVEQGSSLAESLSRFMLSVAGSRDASQEFESTASRWLSPAGFPAAAWIEQVPASQRAAYERRTGNPIVTIDRQLRIVPAGSRSSYRVHSRGAAKWCQARAGSGGSQGFPAMALLMASSAVMLWAAAVSR